MNILITGANGQLGTELSLASSNSKKDNYFYTDIEKLDITNPSSVLNFVKSNEIGIIINCAAYTNVDKAEEDKQNADLINNTAVKYLANAAKAVNATLIHISTDYVFKGINYIPFTENDTTDPESIYGITKLAGENAIINSGCKYIIIRTSWLYSPWENNFVKNMLRLTKEKNALNVIFDQIGSPTYAKDLANAIIWIIDRRMIDQIGIYNFSNEGVCSWYDFAVMINKLAKHNCNISPIHTYEYNSKVKRPHYSVLDKTKFRETFGYVIPHWVDSLTRNEDFNFQLLMFN